MQREDELSEKFPESSAARKKPQKILLFVYRRLGFFFVATLYMHTMSASTAKSRLNAASADHLHLRAPAGARGDTRGTAAQKLGGRVEEIQIIGWQSSEIQLDGAAG